jgi:hypothetical protein
VSGYGQGVLVSIPGRGRHTSGSVSHAASYPIGIWGSGVKRLEREAHNSPPSSVEVKNDGALLRLSSTSYWCGAI